MRRLPVPALVLLATPMSAHAGGYDIAWGPSCWPDNHVSARTFARNSNTGRVAVRNFQYGSTSALDHTLTTAINNACLTWQGAVSPCAAVPAHNVSWGRIKRLFR